MLCVVVVVFVFVVKVHEFSQVFILILYGGWLDIMNKANTKTMTRVVRMMMIIIFFY